MRLPDGFQLVEDGRSSAEGTTPPALPPGFQLMEEPAQVPAQAPGGPAPRQNYGFMDAVWGSMPFADEIAGAAGAVASTITGKPGGYDETRQQEQVDRARYAEQNPGKSALATGAAGLATLGRSGPGAPVGLVNTAKSGAKQGAALGGIFGAGEGDGLGERAANAGWGAVIGGGTGAALPFAVAGGAAVGKGVARAVSPATNALANRLTPDNRAAKLAAEAFRRDGVPIDQAGTRVGAMQRTSPETVLADAGGENVRGLARATVNTPGAGREKVATFMEARRLEQPDRIVKSVGAVLRNPDDFAKTTARMAAERERIASPIYESAFASARPVDVSGVVAAIDRQILPGIHRLIGVADLRPDGITATVGKLRSYFATAANQRTDLRQLHIIKMELDDMVSAAQRTGDNTKARAVMGIKTQLLKAMDRASPDYAKARGIYSSSHEIDEALEIGRSALTMPAEALKTELARMTTPAQREMLQVGIARGVQDMAEKTRDGHDLVRKLFGNKQSRETLRVGFQDDKAFRRFQVTMLREAAMRRTDDAIRGNSTTARQLADLMETHSGGVGRDVLDLLMDGKPGQAAGAVVRQAIAGEKGISASVADKLANLLLSNDPAQIKRAMTSLARKERALGRVKAALTSLGGAGGRLATSSVAASQSSPTAATPQPY